MGEFWLNSPTHDKPNDMLDAISAAHVYGKNIIQAEGFTEVRGVWDETPAMVKPLLDRNFALGMNRLFFHVNTHNPWLDRKPGMTLDGIGLFFQRDQTWFPEAKGFVDYITRCQTLLQEGKPVVDIAVYTGEEIPCRAFTPDKLVNVLPGLFGPERIAAEQKRLANDGQPMIESPVGVRHAAGIIDLKDWVNPLHGYQYDSMNKDALLSRPFGYKMLVIPVGVSVSEEVGKRINELRQQGVQVVERPYQSTMLNGITPDVVLPEGIAFCHRQSNDKEIYFLSNQQDKAMTFKPTFRSKLSVATIYRPQTDEYESLGDGTVTLAPYESCFVLFAQTKAAFGAKFQGVEDKAPVWTEQAINCSGWDIKFSESGVTQKADQLFDWSKSSNDKVKFFSGHARYTTNFDFSSRAKSSVHLALPNVKDIAHVWVNGVDCGYAWASPYEVDITNALKKGGNKLEIEVVNTWHNALRGADKGKAPYKGIWTNAKYRTNGDGLLPAGLLTQPVLKIKK